MKAELVPENGDPPIPITKDLVVVGRRSYCDVVIDHPSLSKRHCVLVKTDGLLVIRDLISTNGTKVKGQKIRWAALLPDDRVSVGAYKLRVYYGPDHLPAPSERYKPRKEKASTAARSPAAASAASLSRNAPVASFAKAVTAPEHFPEPSPLEISVDAAKQVFSNHRREHPTPAPVRESELPPYLPIVLDDSDEIIDLD